jgi:hypothetical protein
MSFGLARHYNLIEFNIVLASYSNGLEYPRRLVKLKLQFIYNFILALL